MVVRGCSHRHSPRAPPIQPTAPTYRAADTNTCVARLQRCACAVSSPRVATCACVAPVPARAGSRGKGKGKGKGTGSTGLSRRTTPSSGGSRGTRAAAPAPRLPAQRVSPNPGTLSRRSHPPNPASILGGEAVDGEAAGNVAASGAGGTSKESGDGEGEGSRSDHRGEGSGLGMAAGLPLHGHKVIIDGYRVGFRCRVHTLVSTLWLTVFSRVVDVAQGNISSRGTAGRSGGAYCGQGYTHCRPCVLCFCVRENRSSPISTRCVRAEAKRNSRISRVATRRNLPSLQLADLKDMKRALMSRSAAAVADSSPAVRGANADDTSQSTITLGSDGTPCKLVAQPTALRYRAHTRRNRCWCLFHGQFMIQCPSRRPRVNKLARWPQPHRLQLTWQCLPPPLRQ